MKRKAEASATADSKNVVRLRLYIAGQTPKSLAAISNLKKICSDYPQQNYRVEVIDLMKNPALAHDHQILAIPTLVRQLPIPIRKIIGDLSNSEQAVVGLDIRTPTASKRNGAKSAPKLKKRAS